jgi:hypothetical protein
MPAFKMGKGKQQNMDHPIEGNTHRGDVGILLPSSIIAKNEEGSSIETTDLTHDMTLSGMEDCTISDLSVGSKNQLDSCSRTCADMLGKSVKEDVPRENQNSTSL